MALNNTGNPVPSASPLDREDNSKIFDELVTSKNKEEVPDRLGTPLKTWHKIQKGIEEQLVAGGRIFPSEAEGRAAVEDDQYYYAISNDPKVSKTLLQRLDSSTSKFIADDPSAEFVSEIFEGTKNLRASGDPLSEIADEYAYLIKDEYGRVAFAIKKDGSLVGVALELLPVIMEEISSPLADEYAYLIQDEDGRVVFAIKKDGTVVSSGDTNSGSVQRKPGVYEHQLNFIINTGQSLGEGSNGTLTTTAEYDNVGFPARSVSPVEYVPLDVENTQRGTRGESPMYGTLGNIKSLIASENGISYQNNDYQLLAANNAYSGASIEELSRGGSTGAFEIGISQIYAALSIATNEGRSFSLRAVLWTQGESDVVFETTKEAYLSKLLDLYADYNADAKMITAQYNDVILITYQTCRDGGQGTVAAAQMQAAECHPNIVLATPIYHLSFYDFQHIDAISSKRLGGYYGAAYKTVVIDKKVWEPLKPTSVIFSANSIDIQFNKKDLQFDASIGQQNNYGFSLVNASGDAVGILSVAIVGTDRVRITADEPIDLGYRIRYGWNSAINRSDSYTGGCGNLRDNAGNYASYMNYPMHNWCVIFDYEV